MNKKDRIEMYLGLLNECVNDGDAESAHDMADDLLCDLLKDIGYEEVVKKYKEVPKWYA